MVVDPNDRYSAILKTDRHDLEHVAQELTKQLDILEQILASKQSNYHYETAQESHVLLKHGLSMLVKSLDKRDLI